MGGRGRAGRLALPLAARRQPTPSSSSAHSRHSFILSGHHRDVLYYEELFFPDQSRVFPQPAGLLRVALPPTALPRRAVAAAARREARGRAEAKPAAARRLRRLLLLLLLLPLPLSHSQSLLPGPEQLSGFHRGTAATSLGGETRIFMRGGGGEEKDAR